MSCCRNESTLFNGMRFVFFFKKAFVFGMELLMVLCSGGARVDLDCAVGRRIFGVGQVAGGRWRRGEGAREGAREGGSEGGSAGEMMSGGGGTGMCV